MTNGKAWFEQREFQIEHALCMYAHSYIILPASSLYDNQEIEYLRDSCGNFHIYFIGYFPRVIFDDVYEDDRFVYLVVDVQGRRGKLTIEKPNGFHLSKCDDYWNLVDADGNELAPRLEEIFRRISREQDRLIFDVRYIGQAFGQDGNRNVIDRLLAHETLQKIAVRGVPDGYLLQLLLLEIQPQNTTITAILPNARNSETSDERLQAGWEKLYGTDEKERIALYEAAMIRYFQPEFNSKFVDSFPSTNLKILQDCYDKDFAAVIAEISFDDLPFHISSENIEAKPFHIAAYNLHSDADRSFFFGL